MENNRYDQQDQSGKSDQTKTADKNRSFNRSGFSSTATENQNTQGGQGAAGDIQEKIQEGKQQAGQFMDRVSKQLRENPLPVIGAVAVGFLLAILVGRSRK